MGENGIPQRKHCKHIDISPVPISFFQETIQTNKNKSLRVSVESTEKCNCQKKCEVNIPELLCFLLTTSFSLQSHLALSGGMALSPPLAENPHCRNYQASTVQATTSYSFGFPSIGKMVWNF